MMIMPGNNGSGIVHFLIGRYPDKIAWINSPMQYKKPPPYMPYALDNGVFTNWQPDKFMCMLDKTKLLHPPLFIVVPDVVGDAGATLIKWHKWQERVTPYGALAFACQDGCNPQDVPPEAYCCFIGGTTEWKLQNAHRFKGVCPWLHVGRVNSPNRVLWAESIGADSIDGTGFFRDGVNGKRAVFLEEYITGEYKQKRLFQ